MFYKTFLFLFKGFVNHNQSKQKQKKHGDILFLQFNFITKNLSIQQQILKIKNEIN